MKKIFSVLTVLLICLLLFTGCAGNDGDDDKTSSTETEGEEKGTITVPEYKDYKRGTIDFSKIEYKRPDFEKVVSDFNEVCEAISENSLPFESLLEMTEALEDGYSELITMRAYASIKSYQDASNAYWQEENEFISTNHPSFAQAVENLFVKAAASPHKDRFEEEYFGLGHLEKYLNGGKYTDQAVALMEKEAGLEAKYTSLSTATVTITYKFKKDTVDNILTFYADSLGKESAEYKKIEAECIEIYGTELQKVSESLLVDLFKVRREISDALGYESYSTHAYDTIYHDYSEADFLSFAEDIAKYVTPVYTKLSSYIFTQCNLPNKSISTSKLVNDVGNMIKDADAELYDIYSYMLQHSLFDIEPASVNRFDGAFTTYLDLYNAPFIFLATSGSVTDYTTLFHEFGHFADAYMNYSDQTSLDLSEVSSQALEMLLLTELEGELSNQIAEKLRLCKIRDALECIIFQGFYATFEHIAYDIPAEKISKESLTEAVILAAKKTGLNAEIINSLDFITIPHIFLYPFYVQSYTTSMTVALEIYFTELESPGEGFEAYKKLIDRENKDLTFEEELESVELTSPFSEDYLLSLADKIHFKLMGSHFFKDNNAGGNAA